MDLSEVPGEPFRRHPWEIARFRFFSELIAQLRLPNHTSVLDVGAGDAWFAHTLRQTICPTARIHCWDTAYEDSHHADHYDDIMCSAVRPDDRYQLILLLDVLEHVEHDVDFLRELVAQNLAANGHLLISVPAWSALYGQHDLSLRHFRRYSPQRLAQVIDHAQLSVDSSGGLFHSLLLSRLWDIAKQRMLFWRRPSHADMHHDLRWHHGDRLGSVVELFLRFDNYLSHAAKHLPIELPGLTTWALCRN